MSEVASNLDVVEYIMGVIRYFCTLLTYLSFSSVGCARGSYQILGSECHGAYYKLQLLS